MSEPRTLLTGLGLVESPRWYDGRLYVSDWSAGEVIAVALDGEREVVAEVDSLPLCTAWSPGGRLIIVDATTARLIRLEPDGTLTTHADLSSMGRGWNDIVIDGRGNAYVNRAGYDPFAGEEPRPGFVSLVTPDGTTHDFPCEVQFPNGMAVTADNATLILADSYGPSLLAFDIDSDGSLSGQRTWATVEHAPDGICVDAEGAVWYATVPGQCCVRVREGGEVLQTVDLDRGGFACVLGGPDRRSLFVVAADWLGTGDEFVRPGSGQVLVVGVDVPGAGWPE